MDPFTFKSLLFLLSFIGCSLGQTIQSLDAILGGNVTLKTQLENPSFAFITWSLSDGVNKPVTIVTVSPTKATVTPAYQGRASANTTNGYLTLMSLKSEDSGDYTVTSISADGVATSDEVKVRVLNPVSDVVITSSLPEAIEYNSTVVLNCTAKGSFLTFTWMNGSSPIVADGSRMTLQTDKTFSALTIRSVLRTDLVGPIYCNAFNNLQNSQSAPFNLTVYYGPDPVTIHPHYVHHFISSNSNFNLSCSAVSSPPATFTWYHSQQAIDVMGHVLTLKEIIDNGLGTQLENYTCIASNAKTLRAISAPAVVFAVMDPISGVTITGPTTTLIAGNSTANLSCQATTGTVMSTTWVKDGKHLTADSRLVFFNNMSSLMINPLQKKDNGQYRCHLKNPVSFVEASYVMVVNFGPEQATVIGAKKVEENKPVTLTCSAESVPPANFTWKLNGTLIGVKTSTFTIQKSALMDSGVYMCVAYNPVTGKTTTFTHNLEVKAEGTLDNGLSDGAIAGIVIAILAAIGAAIALTIYCRQKVPIQSPY